MTRYILQIFQTDPFHLVSPFPWPLYIIILIALFGILFLCIYFNINVLKKNIFFITTPEDSPVDPLPGVKCPKCLAAGSEVWVLPGKHCPKCGHPC